MLYVFFLLPIKYQPISLFRFERCKITKKIISMQLREDTEMTIKANTFVANSQITFI